MNKMRIKLLFLFLLISGMIAAQPSSVKNIDRRVDSVLKLMTLSEKVGQLNQLAKDFATGTVSADRNNTEQQVKNGAIGSFLNLRNIDDKIAMQKLALQSRLRIPLVFGFDVIHGHYTIFPIPLAQAASWDLNAIEKAERIAATEAAADGINWTFAPMVDISYDPRWGRVMEGAGEDPYLGSKIAEARVKGFQGNDLSQKNTVAACVKHFAAYGFAEAGRDYNTVDISEQRLRNIVFPPFQACVNAGAATFMNSFNTLNGVPASMNKWLVSDVLRGEWKFKGIVVSDWNSFGEMMSHGVVASRAEIAQKVIQAGSDMDMEGRVYSEQLEQLVKKGIVKQQQLDEAVKRVLRLKFSLGLFDDPFRYLNKNYREATIRQREFETHSRDLARKSMVLLKNEGSLLPLSSSYKKIAVIGPLADSKQDRDYMSFWTLAGDQQKTIPLATGLKNVMGNKAEIISLQTGDSVNTMLPAVEQAKEADMIIAAVGEHGINNGEARSFANPVLSDAQKQMLMALKKTGKPVVVVLFCGRPLADDWLFDNMQVVLNAWQPGQEAGHAVADVLTGVYNPSGRLTVSWPRSVGQIPLYYNHLNTGRPQKSENDFWVSRYRDEKNEPRFPFGFGLSYTQFRYTNFSLSDTVMKRKGAIKATITITNTGSVAGEEVVQLYTRDLVADISRPVKELKGFEKIKLAPGESRVVSFNITEADLKYWNHLNQYKADTGMFNVMIGPNAAGVQTKTFKLAD
jgi:beta-glucosidase